MSADLPAAAVTAAAAATGKVHDKSFRYPEPAKMDCNDCGFDTAVVAGRGAADGDAT